MKLSDEQKHIIKEVVKFKKPVQTVAGYAGTGKSVIVQHLRHFLQDFAVCAYTGKAAHVLRRRQIPASTIHRLIYVLLRDDYGVPILDSKGHPQFVLADSLNCRGIIVDEASMVSKEIYQDLLRFNLPIIFVGDHGQLEPIGDDVGLMKNPDFKLEKIHRNAGEIAHYAEYIRNGYRPAAFANRKTKAVQFLTRDQAYDRYHEVDQVICGFNQTRVEINGIVRKRLGFPDEPQPGDRVICLRNNYGNGLFNGMQGIIQSFPSRRAKNRIEFLSDDDELYDVFIDPSQFNLRQYDYSTNREDPEPFDYSYALTAHRVQGSEYNRVLVREQRSDRWDFKRWAYTCASRAKIGLDWVAE